jgi:hypothetical protein
MSKSELAAKKREKLKIGMRGAHGKKTSPAKRD